MRYLLVILAVLMLPLNAGANGILLTTAPEFPQAGESVTVTAAPIGDNPAFILFTWRVDGTEVARGYGVSRIVTNAPSLGDSSLVEVTAAIGDALIGTNTIDITPARVTLEWESNGILPPAYDGRPLLGAHGLVRLVAVSEFIQNNVRLSTEDLVYVWNINGTARTTASGYGRSVLITEPPFFNNPFSVEVRVFTRDKKLQARATTTIRPVSPQVLVYETLPLSGGRWWSAVTDRYPFSTSEVSFSAYPTYASPEVARAVTWSLGSDHVTLEGADPRNMVFKKTGIGTGTYTVRAAFENPFKFLEYGAHTFLLQF